MKKLILTLFVLLTVFVAKSQIVNVCGNDTIMLTVDNYVNGTIEWQESIDTINWATIPEVSGLAYTFFPTQTKYYRAVVKTTDCEPLYSAISLVQLSPVANAGTDRIIGNASMTLLGNDEPGAVGEWTILSGTGGQLTDAHLSKSMFSGTDKESYSLKWTLTNACGQSSDTVVIAFDEIVVKSKFIVVDNTDSIYSDSTQIANGIYQIKFSDPTIVPYDSVMLVGMRQDTSFLRKVESFTLQDSVYTFSTIQGSFEDLFVSGVLNIGDAINQALMTESDQSTIVYAFPTRNTLKANENLKGVKLLYTKRMSKMMPQASKSEDTDNSFTLPLDDQTLFKSDDGLVEFSIKNAYIKMDPKFVADYLYTFPSTLTNIKIGADNCRFELHYNTLLSAKQSKEYKGKKTIPCFYKPILVTIGGIPTLIEAIIDIKVSGNLITSVKVDLEEENTYNASLTALIEGENLKNIGLNTHFSASSTHQQNFSALAEASSSFEVGPEITIKIDRMLGAYLKIPVKANLNIRANDDLNWKANASIGVAGIVGITVVDPFLGKELFSYPYQFTSNDLVKTFEMPYKLEYLSGDFQDGAAGEKLLNPISFRAVSSAGFGVPLVPVRFETVTDNGTVNHDVIYTDLSGKVSIDWTLGSNPLNTLKVSILDYNNQDIENSPSYIRAYTTSAPFDCANSNLTINLKTSKGYMYPSVSGGTAPYSYSTDGENFSSEVPQFNITIPGKEIVYVKDLNECMKSRAFELKPVDANTKSNLSFNVLVQANVLTITGKNGTSPYQFAIDSTTNFTSTNTYYKLSAGIHRVYIKDATGSIASDDIAIEKDAKAALRSIYPTSGALSVPVSGFKFQWVAGNYATNQVYDIYLKEGNGAYSLIASNLIKSPYLYNSLLDNNSIYTWKLAVKGSDGVIIDDNEFSFTTASGIATTPTVPVLKLPANGATSQSFPISLSWEKQAGDFKYDLYLDTKDATTLVAMNFPNDLFTFAKLEPGRTYYWKVKVKSTITGATSVSAVRSFTTRQGTGETVTDIDGNVYHTVKIGSQTWMVENLKTTRYRNGEYIGTTTPADKNITNESTPKYQWAHVGDESNASKYGRLYTWYAVNDSRDLAPTGWHVASDAEWTTLENYLIANGYNYDGTTTGNKIGKSLAATIDWYSYSGTGTIGNDLTKNNSSGFTALPGGYRSYDGSFNYVGSLGMWWSSTEYDTPYAWLRDLYSNNYYLYGGGYPKSAGFSVRCVRD